MNFVRRAKEIIIAVVLHSVSGFVRVVFVVVLEKNSKSTCLLSVIIVNSGLLDGALA